MSEQTELAAAGAPSPGEAAQTGLFHQIGLIARALYRSPMGEGLLRLVIGIVAVILATAYGQFRLNVWNKSFFDALARRDSGAFVVQLGVFVLIAGALLVLNVGQRWQVETLKMRLREGLVRDLVSHWMLPRRAFWLAHAGAMGVNPDQRIHDDARNLCEMTADLGVGLFQAAVLFVTFAGVLWVLSADFSVRVGEHDYVIPGFLLWAAILYAAAGSFLSYRVGRNLVHRNAERYAREAELRFSLVRINEHLDGISLAGGEADERRRVQTQLGNVLAATMRLIRGLTNLTWVTAGFGWVTTVAPILVAAPLFFSGKTSFGGVMMAAAAFTQAQSSLRWFVDNFSVIAGWRAALLRVADLRQALTAAHAPQEPEERIVYVDGKPGVLTIEDLEIDSPAGRDRLDPSRLVVQAGEQVLILGARGTGKTQLFRALAGLWPWGIGRIERPAGELIHYMPRGTPYFPRGTLREVLAYPLDAAQFGEGAFAEALGCLGLERLAPQLDELRRWDRELSHDEQLALAFARIVIQAPPWVVMDEAFSALDDEALERIVSIFQRQLRHTAVIHIGGAALAREGVFSRVVHLVKVTGRPEGGEATAAAAPAAGGPR